MITFAMIPFLFLSIPGKEQVQYQTTLVTNEPPPTYQSPLKILKQVGKQIGQNKVANVLWIVYGILLYIFAFFYIGAFYYFEIALLGTAKADKLASICSEFLFNSKIYLLFCMQSLDLQDLPYLEFFVIKLDYDFFFCFKM